jgi:hypothetical protein
VIGNRNSPLHRQSFYKIFITLNLVARVQLCVSFRYRGEENYISFKHFCSNWKHIVALPKVLPCFHFQILSYAVAAWTTAWLPLLTHLSASRWNVTLTCDIGNSLCPTWTTQLSCPHKLWPQNRHFRERLVPVKCRTQNIEVLHLSVSGPSQVTNSILDLPSFFLPGESRSLGMIRSFIRTILSRVLIRTYKTNKTRIGL